MKKVTRNAKPSGPENQTHRAINDGEAAQSPASLAPSNGHATGAGTEETPRKFGRKSQLSPEQRSQAINLIKANPKANLSEVARAVGCSRFAIVWLIKTYEGPELTQRDVAELGLSEYQRLLHRKLPFNVRVKLYSELARGNIEAKRAFSSLKALQRIEELEGIVTKKEQKEAEQHQSPQAPGPVFIIAGGTVSVQPVQVKPQPVVVEAESVRITTEHESTEPAQSTTYSVPD